MDNSGGLRDASVVVLAAGMGSRFGSLKQIEPVGPNGELLIEYSIFDAIAEGFHNVVFVIQREQHSAFQDAIGGKLAGCAKVSYAYQELADLPQGKPVPAGRIKPWGTGHAVLACRDVVQGPFVVINADDFYGRDSYARIARALANDEINASTYGMVGFDLESTLTSHGSVSRGVCSVGGDGFLQSIDERSHVSLVNGGAHFRDADGSLKPIRSGAVASMNMWGFPNAFIQVLAEQFPAFLDSARSDDVQDEYFLPHVVGDLMRADLARVRVLRTDAAWMGVTYREDTANVRARIRHLIEQDKYPAALW